jgi:MFS family permease
MGFERGGICLKRVETRLYCATTNIFLTNYMTIVVLAQCGSSNTVALENGQAAATDKQNSTDQPPPSQFYIISSCYLIFTITDSALRMIVLFQLFYLKFSVLEIAIMFTSYEFVGMITNLLGGILGSYHGLRRNLVVGLLFQLLGIGLMAIILVTESWPRWSVVLFVTVVQAFTGVAKDLVKIAGKSSTKLVKVLKKESEGNGVFKLVAWITGAKNSVKGFGFFLGALLIQFIGYWPSLVVLFAMILILLPFCAKVDSLLGKSKSAPTPLSQIFKYDDKVTTLSAARFFLFASRDVWFEIVLPIYLRTVFGFDYLMAGLVMALWIIFYGAVQSFTPQWILKPFGMFPLTSGTKLVPWTAILAVTILGLSLFIQLYVTVDVLLKVLFLVFITIFGFFFAVNSSAHSYLIVAYSDKDKVAQTLGYYYMANAGGRMIGTLLSGILYYYWGLSSCLWASLGMLVICTILTTRLKTVS